MEHVNAFCCLYFIEFVKIKYSEERLAYSDLLFHLICCAPAKRLMMMKVSEVGTLGQCRVYTAA